MQQYLKFDREPKKVLFVSEPYALYTTRGYQVVADIVTVKGKKEYYIFLGAKSLADNIITLISDNNNCLTGLEVWIYKCSDDKYAEYKVEL